MHLALLAMKSLHQPRTQASVTHLWCGQAAKSSCFFASLRRRRFYEGAKPGFDHWNLLLLFLLMKMLEELFSGRGPSKRRRKTPEMARIPSVGHLFCQEAVSPREATRSSDTENSAGFAKITPEFHGEIRNEKRTA